MIVAVLPENAPVLRGQRIGARVILDQGTPLVIWYHMDGLTEHIDTDDQKLHDFDLVNVDTVH